jgi:hypothetical protein
MIWILRASDLDSSGKEERLLVEAWGSSLSARS